MRISILVTLDRNYLLPLQVMLKSIFVNNPDFIFDIYLAHADIPNSDLKLIDNYCAGHGARLLPVLISDDAFADAPVTLHFSKAMYYRLLAFALLPEDLDKVLYLDPDTLIINSLSSLYNVDLDGYLFAAASHRGLSGISKYVNMVRLGTYDSDGYFNSGVLLMNLQALRREASMEDILVYIAEHHNELLLPDQDVLNTLFGHRILALDDSIYNYDVRYYEYYKLFSSEAKNMAWVTRNTVILHFCGKNKPWQDKYTKRFGLLYKHYMQLARHQAEPRLVA